VVANVLVIDDEAEVLTATRLVLEREGHQVALATDGRAGMAALDASCIEVLILDIFMPGMDGFELLREVHRRRPELPVIVISGASIFSASDQSPDFLAMAVKLGAICGIRKPFTPRELIAAVNQGLGGTATRRRRGKE